jgi:predicted alpha/beta superfamily hydrolase
MNTSVLFLCFLIFVHFNILSQSKIEVIVISSLLETEKVFIAGNKLELGDWNPDKVSLDKINDSTWSKIFIFKIGETIEFKFTKGSWEAEAQDEYGKISGNKTLKVLNDTVLIFKVEEWGNVPLSITGQITGEVRYHKNFKGRSVLPRDIIVWLPPSYDSLHDRFYPVLYMQDGQNVIDPLTSSFGIDWQIDEVADSLIRVKSIQELIVVGIYNTTKRGQEYNNTNMGSIYLNFIIEELKPFIDKVYNTLPDKNNTAICGSSSGGLISFKMIWEYSDVFSKAACISPAFKIGNIDYVAPVRDYLGAKKNVKIYIDNGGIGLEEQLQPGINEMIAALLEKGFVENEDLLFVKDTLAEHNESAWSKRVYRFLEFLFPIKE